MASRAGYLLYELRISELFVAETGVMATSSATRALEQVLGAIDAQLNRLSASRGRIADARAAVLKRLKDALSGGFPPRDAYEPLSLVPFIFQEANYDGIDWLQQSAELAQLTPLFEIDACIWSGGRSLKQFSKLEHADYVAAARRAIQARAAQIQRQT
jgi:hypothetical protein